MRRLTFLLAALLVGACSNDMFSPDDGGLDVATNDGTIPEGGASDVSTAPDALSRFCATIDAEFCADFDTPGDAGAGFTPNISGDYQLSFETTAVESKPTAFEVDVPMEGGIGGLQAIVGVDGGAATQIQIDLDVMLPAVPGPAPAVFAFTFGTIGPPNVQFGLAQAGGSWVLANQSGLVHLLDAGPSTTSWSHVTLAIVPSTSSGSATLTIDGVVVGVIAGVATSTVNAPYPAGVTIGAVSMSGPTAPETFRYDNVVVTFK